MRFFCSLLLLIWCNLVVGQDTVKESLSNEDTLIIASYKDYICQGDTFNLMVLPYCRACKVKWSNGIITHDNQISQADKIEVTAIRPDGKFYYAQKKIDWGAPVMQMNWNEHDRKNPNLISGNFLITNYNNLKSYDVKVRIIKPSHFKIVNHDVKWTTNYDTLYSPLIHLNPSRDIIPYQIKIPMTFQVDDFCPTSVYFSLEGCNNCNCVKTPKYISYLFTKNEFKVDFNYGSLIKKCKDDIIKIVPISNKNPILFNWFIIDSTTPLYLNDSSSNFFHNSEKLLVTFEYNHCKKNQKFEIKNYPNPTFATKISFDCFGENSNGKIELSIDTLKYKVLWFDKYYGISKYFLKGNQFYNYTIIDSNHCQYNYSSFVPYDSFAKQINIEINEPDINLTNGKIDIKNINNDSIQFYFQNQKVYTLNKIDSLEPNLYFLNFKNLETNCSLSKIVTLNTSNNDLKIRVTKDSIKQILYAKVDGGISPYKYSWFTVNQNKLLFLGYGELFKLESWMKNIILKIEDSKHQIQFNEVTLN